MLANSSEQTPNTHIHTQIYYAIDLFMDDARARGSRRQSYRTIIETGEAAAATATAQHRGCDCDKLGSFRSCAYKPLFH